MELKFSPLSPYVRKVMVVAHELGIADRIRLAKVNTAEEPDKIFPFNPLGKIPALVTDAGSVIYDSPVICEYLDAEFGKHRLLPPSGAKRWEVLTRMALADGIMDAAIAIRQESLRAPEQQSAPWRTRNMRKILSGLDALERDAANWDETLDLGRIAAACALGYVPLRQGRCPGAAVRAPAR
jgi:glutathione S-transferase